MRSLSDGSIIILKKMEEIELLETLERTYQILRLMDMSSPTFLTLRKISGKKIIKKRLKIS